MRYAGAARIVSVQDFLDAEPYVTESGTPNRDLLKIARKALGVCQDYFDKITVTRRDQILKEKFHELMHQWKDDNAYESLLLRMTSHPAYRAIIELGEEAIPLLLRELSIEPNFWFAALREITGADPVREEDRGHLQNMTQAWLQWGREQGYSW